MSQRSDIAPDTLSVSLEPEGVEVEYVDGRSVFYHGVPAKREWSVVCGPGKDVHVLVTSPDEREGVMVYVNDRNTHDDILESTGVGRVIIERGEETSLFPGVDAENHGYRVEVSADPEAARGRVFVFAEDEMGEASYEIVSAGDDEGERGAGEGDTEEGDNADGGE
ncbi:DUF5796 family protein [Natronomonas gomsonensis]|uniref:DUF5796 family protein n=1 Tax=Natronomonas gomsonensis TaxID=1046043 RepID=UPI0015BD51E7|nr:DUF5796 family protein [Natronomonas gomsonensis]